MQQIQLNGFWDWLTKPAVDMDATKAAIDAGGIDTEAGRAAYFAKACPPSSASQSLAAKADNLNANWVTTGYYTSDEMRQMVAAALDLTRAASNAALTQIERYSTSDLKSALSAYQDVAKRTVDWDATWKKARAEDAIIDEPSFKRWVINLLWAGNRLMRQVEIAGCQEPFWLGALTAYVHAFDAVIAVAEAIGKAVVDAGRKIIRAVGWWWPYLKWGSIGAVVLAGGVYGWNKYVSIAEAGRRPIDWSKIFPKRKPTQVAGHKRGRRGR